MNPPFSDSCWDDSLNFLLHIFFPKRGEAAAVGLKPFANLKMVIYSGFPPKKWCFSTIILYIYIFFNMAIENRRLGHRKDGIMPTARQLVSILGVVFVLVSKFE